MDNMEDAVIVKREDFCPCCKKERSIECYNNKGEPINYSIYLDKRDSGNIVEFKNKGYITNMSCTRCRTKFIIDWTRPFPRPLLFNGFYKSFMKNYR